MATTGKGPTRSDFLRDLFQKNPGVSENEAAQAWAAAGNEGTISPSSFYTAKRASKGGAGDTACRPRETQGEVGVQGAEGQDRRASRRRKPVPSPTGRPSLRVP